MRPHSNGSSTIGVKKSVVTTIARSSRRRYTAASSEVSSPTRRFASGVSPRPRTSPRTVRRSAGESLQAQPAPCEKRVSRIGDSTYVMPWMLGRGLRESAGPCRALVQADVVVTHDITRVRRVDHPATTRVDPDVTGEPHQIARLHLAQRHVREHSILRL